MDQDLSVSVVPGAVRSASLALVYRRSHARSGVDKGFDMHEILPDFTKRSFIIMGLIG